MKTATVRSETLALVAAGFAALLLVPGSAAAKVFEIADDGSLLERVGEQALPVSDAGFSAAAGQIEAAPDVPDAAVTLIAEPSVPPNYRASLHNAANRYGVSPSLLAALARQESGWREGIVSPKGAIGLTQLMPATARELAVDARDPASNLDGGARYLRQQLDRFDGDVERALAAYNAGPGRVLRARGIPAIAETRAYVTTIINRLGERVEAAWKGDR